ncbi:hypothetical protein RJD24_12150 [Bacillaceae bacterium IKA-2]|nr:hypothetical protein RJD24_12150 [Bacillaceae bacterium IKA-2]
METNFLKSFEKVPRRTSFRAVLSNEFKGNSFKEDITDEYKTEFNFYNNNVKKSRINKDLLFTNYLSNRTPRDITDILYQFHQDPSIIERGKIDQVRLNRSKIKQCLSIYYELQEEEEEYVFKANIETLSAQKIEVRIYCVVDLDSESKHINVNIITIDPFHLVIPSDHRGEDKLVVEKRTFDSNSQNKICISNYLTDFVL